MSTPSSSSPIITSRPAPPFLAVTLVSVLLFGASGAWAQGLQDDIDQAAPGDTVLVAPGSYSRAVTVDKSITILADGPGEVRLAGIGGVLATVVGIIFDGSLNPVPGELVAAGDALTFEDCTFESSIRAVRVLAGAQNVVLRRCFFDATLEAVSLDPGVMSVSLVECTLTDCTLGLVGNDAMTCPGGPARTAATRCEAPCGRVQITDCVFSGGDRQIQLAGDYTPTLHRNWW